MRKFFAIFVVALSLVVSPAFAAVPQKPTLPEPPALPEVSGEYIVPNRPDLLLRVIPHPEKPNHTVQVTKAVCTADNDSTATTGGAGWHFVPGTVAYHINYSTVPFAVGQAAAKEAFSNAFATWDSLVSSVSIVEGSPTSVRRTRFDGQNVLFWGRVTSSAIAITYIWYYPSTGQTAEVDTVYNSRYRWSYTPYNVSACGNADSYDVQNIATHEDGHWFGLDDQYDPAYVDNTMYGYGELGELKKDTLTTGDISGLTAIYH